MQRHHKRRHKYAVRWLSHTHTHTHTHTHHTPITAVSMDKSTQLPEPLFLTGRRETVKRWQLTPNDEDPMLLSDHTVPYAMGKKTNCNAYIVLRPWILLGGPGTCFYTTQTQQANDHGHHGSLTRVLRDTQTWGEASWWTDTTRTEVIFDPHLKLWIVIIMLVFLSSSTLC